MERGRNEREEERRRNEREEERGRNERERGGKLMRMWMWERRVADPTLMVRPHPSFPCSFE